MCNCRSANTRKFDRVPCGGSSRGTPRNEIESRWSDIVDVYIGCPWHVRWLLGFLAERWRSFAVLNCAFAGRKLRTTPRARSKSLNDELATLSSSPLFRADWIILAWFWPLRWSYMIYGREVWTRTLSWWSVPMGDVAAPFPACSTILSIVYKCTLMCGEGPDYSMEL